MSAIPEYEDHPIAAKYPLLEGEEFERLKESIRLNGQRIAIVLFQGKILDGRNRYRACRALGVAVKTEVFEGTEDEARLHADVLNLDRRHLTRDQIRAVIEYKVKREPERSDRSIAAEVKVSDKTVAVVRRKLEATAEIPQLATRQGRDGKKRPAADPARKKWDQEQKNISRRVQRQATTKAVAVSPGKDRAAAVEIATEAINVLSRLPRTNTQRQMAFNMVASWIESNGEPREKRQINSLTDSPSSRGRRAFLDLFDELSPEWEDETDRDIMRQVFSQLGRSVEGKPNTSEPTSPTPASEIGHVLPKLTAIMDRMASTRSASRNLKTEVAESIRKVREELRALIASKAA